MGHVIYLIYLWWFCKQLNSSGSWCPLAGQAVFSVILKMKVLQLLQREDVPFSSSSPWHTVTFGYLDDLVVPLWCSIKAGGLLSLERHPYRCWALPRPDCSLAWLKWTVVHQNCNEQPCFGKRHHVFIYLSYAAGIISALRFVASGLQDAAGRGAVFGPSWRGKLTNLPVDPPIRLARDRAVVSSGLWFDVSSSLAAAWHRASSRCFGNATSYSGTCARFVIATYTRNAQR